MEALQIAEQTTQELLSLLTIEASVSAHKRDEAVWITIESPEAAMLIGHHGRSLEALQILISQMVYKARGEWIRVVVSVGDYRERREKQLTQMAEDLAHKVVQSGEPMEVPNLSPAERRIIHIALSNNPAIVSESQGEGKDRKLIVKLRVQS